MIRLDLSREPRWLDLGHGVRLRVAPLTTSFMAAARSDPSVTGLPEGASNETIAVTMAKALARLVVLDWEGVGDADGEPVPVTPEGIDALLDILPLFEAFQLRYVSKGLLLEEEKNGSAPSANGTSAGATGTADPAAAPARECPAVLNRPLTIEGWQVWDLAQRLTGQLRAVPGAILGLDMTAALAMADALGIDTLACAELLPEVEGMMVRGLNAQIRAEHDG